MDLLRDELQHRLKRETAVSRSLALRLFKVEAERDEWRRQATGMAEGFMRLHNLAKDVVGPKQ